MYATFNAEAASSPLAAAPWRSLIEAAAQTCRRLAEAHADWRARKIAAAHLKSLSDYQLKDMGVSRCQIEFAVRFTDASSRRAAAANGNSGKIAA